MQIAGSRKKQFHRYAVAVPDTMSAELCPAYRSQFAKCDVPGQKLRATQRARQKEGEAMCIDTLLETQFRNTMPGDVTPANSVSVSRRRANASKACLGRNAT